MLEGMVQRDKLGIEAINKVMYSSKNSDIRQVDWFCLKGRIMKTGALSPCSILHADNWYVLAVAILSEQPLTVEEAFNRYDFRPKEPGARYKIDKGREAYYMHEKGISWHDIETSLCLKNPHGSVYGYRSRLKRGMIHDQGRNI